MALTDHTLLLLAMEDAHAIEMSLDEKEEEGNAFFAVYDGHGGTFLASYPSSSSAFLNL